MIVWAVRNGVKYVPEFSKKIFVLLSCKYDVDFQPSGSAVTLSSDTNVTVAINCWTHSFGIIRPVVNLSPGQKFAANEIHGTINGFLTKPDLCLRLQCIRFPTRIHLRGKCSLIF